MCNNHLTFVQLYGIISSQNKNVEVSVWALLI